MYCYNCGSFKTKRKCPVCGADESRRSSPQSELARALRGLFDMDDIGPASTIGNPEQFELLMTDILPGDRYRYIRSQIYGIISVYNVHRMLMDQIGMHRPPDRDMFRLLCENALETGYSLKTCREVISILYEMIGWQVQSGTNLSELARRQEREDSLVPPAAQEAEGKKPVPGENLTISIEFTNQELADGCVRKWPVNRRGICPICKGIGVDEDGSCRYCRGLGVSESTSVMTLSFPACPDASSFIFVGQGSIGLYGGKNGDLRVLVVRKQGTPLQALAQKAPVHSNSPHRAAPAKPVAAPAKPAARPNPPPWKTSSPYLGTSGRGSYGSDVIVNLTVTPLESRTGCSKRIVYDRQVSCPSCRGNGCSVCGSKGFVKKQDEITVTVSPHPGDKQFTLPVLHGRGNESLDGKSTGNLLIRVKVEP